VLTAPFFWIPPPGRPTILVAAHRRSAVATTPAPPPTTTTPEKASTGDVWAFRLFVVLFFLTLIIGLSHFILSAIKYANDK
jgi:hypothetical protein